MESVFLPRINSQQLIYDINAKQPVTGSYDDVKIVPAEIVLDGKSLRQGEATSENGTKSNNSFFSCFQVLICSILIISVICFSLIFFRKHIREILLWLEELDIACSCALYLLLFIVVSFPLFWGFLLLIISAGYLYGLLCGACLVVVCASCGVLISHITLQRTCNRQILDKFYNEKIAAIIRVVESDQGFKVITLARLTPIPFGLQNAIFAMADVHLPRYCIASSVGLVPMAVLNCYLGSTLRSMTDVFTNGEENSTAYFIFAMQIVLTVGLMVFVVRKAREELSKAVASPHRSSSNGSNVQLDV